MSLAPCPFTCPFVTCHSSLVTVLKREHELLDLATPLFGICDLPPVQAFVQRELLLRALLVLGAD